ncbi:Glyoxalase-like domain-containing protein [Promicromonospora umidemergens]|uniref:VOC domain-containing protein n=1 Tax=Promicromonospora umidemergens TaxID=629679 RepID=A0ABP8WMC8_9MICO|nr:VOC family protein [Promicromonospora umidemergens]MCP2285871.1 Glyoxalase-like domain-containing protein [Promicromonospora umidemergens]
MTEPSSVGPAAARSASGGVGTVHSVVLDVPDLTAEADFWTALTDGTVAKRDDDWITVVTPDRWGIAFQLAPDLVPPQWPGQEHPQQAHLDLYVPDLAAASTRAVELGATVLREGEQWITLADPAGHPFDVCLDEKADGVSVMGATFDCADASALARFWSGVMGEPVTYDADGVAMLGGSRPLLFQTVERYNPPRWPDPAYPQQLHLDIEVPDLDAGEAAVLAQGATRLPGQGDDFRVFADPAGHPFCLVR